MDKPEKIEDIEYMNTNKNNNYVDNNNNEEPIYKLDFNFDILNEPMPDFTKSKSKENENKFLNKNNFAYKRKYNEINFDNNYSYHGKAKPKLV